MIYCLWKNAPDGEGIPLCACSGNNPDELVAEVSLFPIGGSDSILLDSAAGEKVALPGSFSARSIFSAVILAQAVKVVNSINLSGSILLFSDGLIGEAVRSALPEDILVKTVVARVSPLIEKSGPVEANGNELNPFAIGFIDSLKAMTEGKGFANVILASPIPELVKKALGCAGILGEVSLLLPILGKVSVDLTATVNFKSLIIRARSFFSGLGNLTDRDIAASVSKIDSLLPQMQAGEEESGLEIVSKRG